MRPACKICARTRCFVQRTFLFTLRRLPPQREERTVRGPSCGSLQILFPHLRLDCFRKPTACRVRHLWASFLGLGHGLITPIRFLQFTEKCKAHQYEYMTRQLPINFPLRIKGQIRTASGNTERITLHPLKFTLRYSFLVKLSPNSLVVCVLVRLAIIFPTALGRGCCPLTGRFWFHPAGSLVRRQ